MTVHKVAKILSGGQTGVDRAALDVAFALGLACGGWCPRGRRAEDGPIPRRYPLSETPATAYAQRTRWNVRDADATLILTRGAPRGGTLTTLRHAMRVGKPCLVVDLADAPAPGAARDWLAQLEATVLNVAGPRESQAQDVGGDAAQFLRAVLDPAGCASRAPAL